MNLNERRWRQARRDILVTLITSALIGLAVGLVGRMIVMELRA